MVTGGLTNVIPLSTKEFEGTHTLPVLSLGTVMVPIASSLATESALVTESPPEVKVTAGVEDRDLSALKVNVTTSAALARVEVELFEDKDTELNSGAVVSI